MIKKMIRNFKSFMSTYPLEVRILILAAMGGLILGVISSIINISLKLGTINILVTLATSGIALLILYFAFVKKKI